MLSLDPFTTVDGKCANCKETERRQWSLKGSARPRSPSLLQWLLQDETPTGQMLRPHNLIYWSAGYTHRERYRRETVKLGWIGIGTVINLAMELSVAGCEQKYDLLQASQACRQAAERFSFWLVSQNNQDSKIIEFSEFCRLWKSWCTGHCIRNKNIRILERNELRFIESTSTTQYSCEWVKLRLWLISGQGLKVEC